MYATGSREEIEALTKHLIDNHRCVRYAVEQGDVAVALDLIDTGQLFAGMLLDAVRDHFNGKN